MTAPDATDERFLELKSRLAQVADLGYAAAVLSWDQETMMPPGGAEGRADQLATLGSLAHRLFTSDEVGGLLDALAPWAEDLPFDSAEASLVRVRRRDFDRLVRVPTSLVETLARTTSLALQAWREARATDRFAHFAPHLERVLELRVRWAECFAPYDNPYDPLLDGFEAGMTYDGIRRVFDGLRPPLVELVSAIAARRDPREDAPLERAVAQDVQMAFSREVTAALGYDYERGRIDLSAHPFSTRFSPGDVRITTRVAPLDPLSSLMSSIHEAGHAIHAQRTAPSLYRTGLDGGAMQAISESQSRFYENVIGRGEPFWRWLYPRFIDALGSHLGEVSPERLRRVINRVEPGLIRVEADEVTYGLHIMLRFELENDLVNGRLPVSELPRAWNDRMEAYLGVRPGSDADGVLQDIHWSMGAIGYFPDYLLGSLFSVQLWDAMRAERPDVESEVEGGDFGGVLAWLEERVMQHGRKFTLPELAERAVGGPLRFEPYLDYLRERYGRLYGVGAKPS